MEIEVETQSVDGETTALGRAGQHSVIIDRSIEEGGNGRGFSAEELLCLAVSGSLSNAIFQEAQAMGTDLTRVVIRVSGSFVGNPAVADAITCDVEVDGDALPDQLRAIVDRADAIATVVTSLRRGTPFQLRSVTVRPEFPRRTLDEVLAVARFMDGWPGRWWVGGGWAIDLWSGGVSREHEDIEICVPRKDQHALREFVAQWQSYSSKNERWVPLGEEEMLEYPVSMWQLRRTKETPITVGGMPPRWEFLLNEVEGDEWICALDRTIRLPLGQVIVPSPLGPPVMAPEVVLLHKSFQVSRPKDDRDFLWVVDRLSPAQLQWLSSHLRRLKPGHRWLAKFDSANECQ